VTHGICLSPSVGHISPGRPKRRRAGTRMLGKGPESAQRIEARQEHDQRLEEGEKRGGGGVRVTPVETVGDW